MVKTQFSICIVGRDQEKYLEECIGYASKMSQEILYVDLGSKDNSVKIAERLVAKTIKEKSSLGETAHLVRNSISSNWLLFIKPDERVTTLSSGNVEKVLKNSKEQTHTITIKQKVKYDLLEQFQLVSKLSQFKNVNNCTHVPWYQIRLVRCEHTFVGLNSIINYNANNLPQIANQLIDNIIIEPFQTEEDNKHYPTEDTNLQCLIDDLSYEFKLGENFVELSDSFTGFSVVHKGHLDGFLESAQRGFGHPKIYIPMLNYLCKEGYFDEAKDLFETWIEHRPDDKENYVTQYIGSVIYAKLLELDKAIEWAKKITNKKEDALALVNLGKFYLLKSENEKAVECLDKSGDVKGAYLLERIIQQVKVGKERLLSKLSLCMIVKDEEAQIERALRSMAGIADEIIVVDTGSSDSIAEILRHFGGKVIQTEWEDDFSKARNIAIEEATGDYILFMDADEYIDPRDRFSLALLKKLLPHEKDIAFSVKLVPFRKSKGMSEAALGRLIDEEKSHYQVRLFPKKPGISFHGKVFEDIEQAVTRLNHKIVRSEEFKITYSIEEREKSDKRKIPAVLSSFKTTHDPEKLIKGGLFFLQFGDLEQAYLWFRKAEGISSRLSAKIGILYLRHNKTEMAKKILERAILRFPEAPELILPLSQLYYKVKNYDELINLVGKRVETINTLELEDAAEGLFYYGIALIETGDLPNGVEQIAHAHGKDPANVLYKMAGIFTFARVNQWEEALQATAQIAEEEHIEIVNEVNDFMDVGRIFIAMNRHFMQAGMIEEADLCQKILEYIIKTKISGEENIRRMSEVIEGLG